MPFSIRNSRRTNFVHAVQKTPPLSKRFLSNLNDENMKGVWHMAGPGSYDVDNSWNKKTYNVLFSGNQ